MAKGFVELKTLELGTVHVNPQRVYHVVALAKSVTRVVTNQPLTVNESVEDVVAKLQAAA